MPTAYFNGQPLFSGGNTNVTFGDTLIEKDGVIEVTNPVHRVISQEDFDALPAEEKNSGLYVVRGNGQTLSGIEIEEYDAIVDDCDWHVRKWSNGYVEMSGAKWYSGIVATSKWGEIYQSDSFSGPMLPLTLSKKYRESANIINKEGYVHAAFISVSSGNFPNLSKISSFRVYRAVSSPTINFGVNWIVTGRWK